MKSTELRLGNYVYSCKGGIETIVGMVAFGIEVTFEPIPLTKEWLLKFGFNANRYNDEFELYPLMFDCEYTDHGEWNISYDGHPLSTEVKYVHQLQNLYFALTGEELTLKS